MHDDEPRGGGLIDVHFFNTFIIIPAAIISLIILAYIILST